MDSSERAKDEKDSLNEDNVYSFNDDEHLRGRSLFIPVYREMINDILKLFEFVLICVVIIVAIFSIYNISARETLSKSIEQKIHLLNSEFVSTNKIVLTGKLSVDNQTDVAMQLSEITNLERLSSQIQALKAYGGSNVLSLDTIKSGFISTNTPIKEPVSTGTEKEKVSVSVGTNPFGELTSFFSHMSSDILLAFSLLSCGALGAVIASIRSDNNVNLSKFTIGFTTGFITYLGIKGGQFVFLLQVPGAAAVLNPYTASFIGLISGMFSERFHLILGNFMDKASSKLMDNPEATK